MEEITVRNLSFSYPETEKKALNNINLDIRRGDFWVICGPSGCGKSTLLRQFKSCLAPKGKLEGGIFFDEKPLSEMSDREQAEKIGFVQQSPDNQIVTDKVWHELAFGLESLGYETSVIRKRVAEMASFFGIEKWFYKNVTELSGGQKQLMNLASIMVMQPELLILDEPTSQLDPIAASEFLSTIGRINHELGTTVILTEHRLEDSLPLANRVAVIDKGSLLFTGSPKEVGMALKDRGHGMFLAMPTPMRVWAAAKESNECPITVNEGRRWLKDYCESHALNPVEMPPEAPLSKESVISLKDVWFKYDKTLPDVVKGLSLEVKKGEFLTIIGGNGAGKSTTLGIMGGILKPYRGEIRREGKIALLPQNPQTIFVKNTVRSDLYEIFRGAGTSKQDQDEAVKHIISICHLEELMDRHPYDLSGGEQQRAALAKVLLLGPDVLLLDEPTKGLDAEFKQEFAEILQRLIAKGVTVVMLSHDVEFAAKYSSRCCMFFDGNVVSEGSPKAFFSGNSFYTTSAAKMSKDIAENIVTAEDLIYAVSGKKAEKKALAEDIPELPKSSERSSDYKPQPLPLWRKVAAAISLLVAAYVFVQALGVTDLSALVTSGGITGIAKDVIPLYAAAIGALLVFALSVARKAPPAFEIQTPEEKRKLSRRTLVATVMLLLAVPLTLFIGAFYLGSKKYYFTALLILLECMSPFFLIFEDRKPKARELVVIASLAAINVAGRSIFFMLPEFKPVFAITIIAGVVLGGETGFLVGALTMLASNVMFGQGPWTPWQMFSLGIIGFFAGVLYKKGLLRRTRMSLCVYGAFSGIVIYGGLMNPVSALLWAGSGTLTWETVMAYYITGFPVDCVRAVATVIFLFFLAYPMIEKLERIKTKYGLID